jgi:NTP pyrophosphatase (non-canonical NTP hydrolase)
MASELDSFQERICAFVRERDWEQFHTPKNLAMALAGEAAELMELFQWLTPEQSAAIMTDAKRAEAVRDEVADILFYTLRVADVLGIDLFRAVDAKMAKNAAKYPVELAKGKATKYDELKRP